MTKCDSTLRVMFEAEILRSPYAELAESQLLFERSSAGEYSISIIQAAWWGFKIGRNNEETRRIWTPDDDMYLRENSNSSTYKEIGEHLGRSTGSVRLRAQILGLKRNTSHKENDQKILDNRSKPDVEIAKMLGVTTAYVAKRRHQLGISNRTIPRFTDDELVILRDKSLSSEQVAIKLGRKLSSIKNKRRALGVK